MNDVGKQEHKEKKAAVILAAGSGRRMNTPVAKQFLDLMGIPVFLHSVRLLLKDQLLQQEYMEVVLQQCR